MQKTYVASFQTVVQLIKRGNGTELMRKSRLVIIIRSRISEVMNGSVEYNCVERTLRTKARRCDPQQIKPKV
jgi:hypothetical protein